MKSTFQKAWTALDYGLLAAVFVMLGKAFLGFLPARQHLPAEAAALGEALPTAAAPVAAAPEPRPQQPHYVVNGVRVDNRKLPQIARSLASSAWDTAPASPTLDMREDGKAYEVAFSIPDGINPKDARVQASGRMLSLSLTLPGGNGYIYRRVLIPCEISSEGQMQSLFTNGVLRIRITPNK